MSQQDQYIVGIDIGATKIEIGVVNQRGKIQCTRRVEIQKEKNFVQVQSQLIEIIREFQHSFPCLIAIGIGIAGQIDIHTGEVLFAPNLQWKNVPLQKNLAQIIQLPVRVVNDVHAITWGEKLFGAGTNCDDLLCLFIGTGIGAAFVHEGHFLTGITHTFGEIGHMTVDYKGLVCSCGKQGCLESIAGGWGIAMQAKELIKRNPDLNPKILLSLAHQKIDCLTAKTVIEAYRLGDEVAKQVMEQAEQALILGCASAINILNPKRLILGGGVLDGMPEWIPMIEKGIKEYALQAATRDLEVVKAKLGKKVGVIGSAAFMFHTLTQP
jgi:glucokinase